MLANPVPAITHRMQLVIMITAAVVVIAAELSIARELRPSDHGLEYQTAPPTSKSPPEMEEFFGALNAPPPPSSLALPWAKSSNDTSWWRNITSRNRGGGVALGGHARRVLVLLSFVCGVAGLVLLVASGLVHLFRRMKNKKQMASVSSAGEDNNGGNGSRSVVSK